MRNPAIRLALLLLILASASHHLAGSTVQRKYSDVQYIAESGDRAGIEVQLTIAGDGDVNGVLLHYQGFDAEPVALVGQLTGKTLEAAGSTADARVTIEARVIDKHLVGVLRYHLSRQVNDFKFDLPEVERSRVKKE